MKLLFTFLLGLAAYWAQSQAGFDTLRVMQYNILFYGQQTSFCTNSNNNINDKDEYFKIIVGHIKPDLLLVNEMGASVVYADRIIANVLNVDGESRFKRAGIQNNGFSSLVNGVFYDKTKLALLTHEKVIRTLSNTDIVRAIDICTFYYKDPNLTPESDTNFIYLVGMHLKAGSSASDQDQRDLATESVMDYISNNYPEGNYLLAGDMNLKSSSEPAYQNMINHASAFRMNDPLDENGNWSNNASFAAIHTQSTHTSGSCHSGGGLDDRFDIILMSNALVDGEGPLEYIEETYKAVGNDGNHFNQALTQGTNNSVPSPVLGALYEMSDHLPVTADISISLLDEPDTADTIPEGVVQRKTSNWNGKIIVNDQTISLSNLPKNSETRLFDLFGRQLFYSKSENKAIDIPTHGLLSGMYIVHIKTNQYSITRKVILSR
ncbi:MAG: T9SS type A sorting domain-containing protein [Salibacteraceae bacterium]